MTMVEARREGIGGRVRALAYSHIQMTPTLPAEDLLRFASVSKNGVGIARRCSSFGAAAICTKYLVLRF